MELCHFVGDERLQRVQRGVLQMSREVWPGYQYAYQTGSTSVRLGSSRNETVKTRSDSAVLVTEPVPKDEEEHLLCPRQSTTPLSTRLCFEVASGQVEGIRSE
jgi:hypothetical protein